jgi:hypothetical protein
MATLLNYIHFYIIAACVALSVKSLRLTLYIKDHLEGTLTQSTALCAKPMGGGSANRPIAQGRGRRSGPRVEPHDVAARVAAGDQPFNMARPCVERRALLRRPVVALIDADDAGAAARNVVE